LRDLSGVRLAAGDLVYLVVRPVVVALILLFLLFLLRLLVRNNWLAVCLFVLFLVSGAYTGNWQVTVMLGFEIGLFAMAMMRYGLVTFASTSFSAYTLITFPVTLNPSVWYAGIGLAPLFAVLALAVFAFYTSLGGQKVFQGGMLED